MISITKKKLFEQNEQPPMDAVQKVEKPNSDDLTNEKESKPSLFEIFPDLPETDDPCVLAEFFIVKCDEKAQNIEPQKQEKNVDAQPVNMEPGTKPSPAVEITPKGVMPVG